MTSPHFIEVTTQVTTERLRGLLCGALEGGSNYWYVIVGYQQWDGNKYVDIPRDELPEFPHITLPFQRDRAIVLSDLEDSDFEARSIDENTYLLGLNQITSGAKAMAAQYPRHWADFIAENDDADTSDVFLQCCIFGTVVYG
jgi:hypothetical protein